MSKTYLTIVAGAQPKKYILNSNAITIGSGAANSINLPVASIAKTHCSIKRLNNRFVLQDDYKQGDIYVNGVKISSQPLVSGDMIQLDSVVLKFEIIEEAPVTNPGAGAKSGSVVQKQQPHGFTQPPEKKIPSSIAHANPTAVKGKTVSSAMQKGAALKRRTAAAVPPKTGLTQKQLKTFYIFGGILAVVIIGFFVVTSNSGPTQEELNKELVEINNKANDLYAKKKVIEAGDLLEKTIADERYKDADLSLVKGTYKNIAEQVDYERKAKDAVDKFEGKIDAAKDLGPIKPKEAQQFLDECKDLIRNYSTSAKKPKLDEIKTELEKIIESQPGTSLKDEYDKIIKESERLLNENNYSKAVSLWDNFKKKCTSDPVLGRGANDELDAINQKAKGELKQIQEKVAQLKKEGKSTEAGKQLTEALPRFKGTGCYKELEQLQQQFNK